VTVSLRNQVSAAICAALRPLPDVLAGWEGGSAAFGTLDAYSDLDLNFLVTDEISTDRLHAVAANAMATVSPIGMTHDAPPGRYYKLRDGGEFFLVDLCFYRVGAPDHHLDADRHGQIRPLFDKSDWLQPPRTIQADVSLKRVERYDQLKAWFPASQSFVRKAILRGQHAEALAAFWGYSVRPLAELLRMRYCPLRWDFGMRYLDRDLPAAIYSQFTDLLFVRDLSDLETKLEAAASWGSALLKDLDQSS
jgi:hypothetical protein